MIDWMIAKLMRVKIWTLMRSGKRRGWNSKETERLAKRELAAVQESIRAHFEYQTSEADILSERLSRRYDPGMALNEAANRAMVQKQAARDPQLTDRQKLALKFQEEELKRRIARS